MKSAESVVGNTGKVPSLTSVGLSTNTDLIYRCLATAGPCQVGDLIRLLGLPSRQIRQSLDELADITAAKPAVGRGQHTNRSARTWSAGEPDAVAARVRDIRHEAARTQHRIRRQLVGLSELGVSSTSRNVQIFGGCTRAQARVVELAATERYEHLAMNPDLSFSAAAVRAVSPVHKKMVEQKIAIKELSVPMPPEDTNDDLTTELMAAGAQFRELPSVPAKIMIIDRRRAVVRVDPADAGKGLIEIIDQPTVLALVDLFFRQWELADDHRGRTRPVELTPREDAIVRRLGAGRTDSETAAELGVSVRTVAYAIHDLMERYDVRNRFQLGVALGPLLGDPEDNPKNRPNAL
jgi:DNA-binding CsgD family transcriptional regulator